MLGAQQATHYRTAHPVLLKSNQNTPTHPDMTPFDANLRADPAMSKWNSPMPARDFRISMLTSAAHRRTKATTHAHRRLDNATWSRQPRPLNHTCRTQGGSQPGGTKTVSCGKITSWYVTSLYSAESPARRCRGRHHHNTHVCTLEAVFATLLVREGEVVWSVVVGGHAVGRRKCGHLRELHSTDCC